MLKVLVKKELAEIFRSYFYNAKKNKARSKGATAAYFVLFAFLMVGFLGGVFAILAQTLCGPLHSAGMDWLYFAMMGLIAILWTFSRLYTITEHLSSTLLNLSDKNINFYAVIRGNGKYSTKTPATIITDKYEGHLPRFNYTAVAYIGTLMLRFVNYA